MKKNFLFAIALFVSLSLNVQAQNLTIREKPKFPAYDLPLKEFTINDKYYVNKGKEIEIPSFIKGGIFLNDKMSLNSRNTIFKGNLYSSAYGVNGGLFFVRGIGSKTGLLNVQFSNNAAISNSKEGIESKGAYGGAVYLDEGAEITFKVRFGTHLFYKGNYACENGVKKNENGGFIYIGEGKNIEQRSMHRVILSIAENSSLTIGDIFVSDCDSIASKDSYSRVIKVGEGICNINSNTEHFLGIFHTREGSLSLNNKLGASKIIVGGLDNKNALLSLRIKDNNALSNKELSSIIIQKNAIFRLVADEDIFNTETLSYTLSASENCVIENKGKILSYGAKFTENSFTLNPIQTLTLGTDNLINVSPYDRILVKDFENNKKAMLSFSNFEGGLRSLSVSTLSEESLKALNTEISALPSFKNARTQALYFKSGTPLTSEENVLISMYVGDYNIDLSRIFIYLDEGKGWKKIIPTNLSFNGKYISFETNKFGSYAYVVRKTTDEL